MKKQTYPSAVLVTALLSIGAPAWAQEVNEDDPIIVTANRLPEALTETSSEVTVFTAEKLETRQQDRLQDALQLAPGVISTSTAGQEGQTGTLIVRGLPTRYNQVLIDGVRISDAVTSSSYGNVFGNLQLGANEQLEVVTGSQGVVHGNAAIGGVIGINNTFSEDAPAFQISQEVGSFDYLSSKISSNATIGDVSYNLNLNYTEFEQDLGVGNSGEVENRQASVGVKYDLTDTSSVILTARYGELDLFRSSPDFAFDSGTEYSLFSAQFNTQSATGYKGSAVISYYDQDFSFADDSGTSVNDLEKFSITYDGSAELNDRLTTKFGAEFSRLDYSDAASFPPFFEASSDIDWTTYAAHAGLNYTANAFAVDGGIRVEHNSEFDTLLSAHLLGKYDYNDFGAYAKLSFANRAPSLLESEAFPSTGQIANDDLDEESVFTIEAGVSQSINGSHELAITGYAHFLDNAINPVQVAGGRQQQNLGGISEIFGLDASLRGEIAENLFYSVAWNYSLKNDLFTRLPRNTVSADLHYAVDRWSVGVGLYHQSNAHLAPPQSAFPFPTDARLVARIYGHYELTENLKLSARVENLFDENYVIEGFAGEEGRRAAAFVGLTATW